MSGWQGVDLDATAAVYDKFQGPGVVGEPIMRTIRRMRYWLRKGRDVRWFTARVHVPKSIFDPNFQKASQQAIEAAHALDKFSLENLGRTLPITCEKDYHMVSLLDDRVEQVIPNTGKLVRHELRIAVSALLKIADPAAENMQEVAKQALAELDTWSVVLAIK